MFGRSSSYQPSYVAALDVGSSKIVAMIAEVDPTGQARIIGVGHQMSAGVRFGSIVDMDAAYDAILNAVYAAEQMADQQIESVVINLGGGHPSSHIMQHVVPVQKSEISIPDLIRLSNRQNFMVPNDDRQLLHLVPISYSVDDNKNVRDPKGMFGKMVGVNMNVITAGTGPIRNLASCISRCHLDISQIVVSPYASGLSCLVPDEREMGVILLDMGGGTTSIAVFLEGKIVYTDMVPVGGGHVTNDIARGLSTPIAVAEKLKLNYGNASYVAANQQEMITIPQVGEDFASQKVQIPRSMLVSIIKPRIEEVFELVRDKLKAGGFYDLAGRRLVLTGGASQLAGIKDIASLTLEKKIRIGHPLQGFSAIDSTNSSGPVGSFIKNPAYATCTGLLAYIINDKIQKQANPMPVSDKKGPFGKTRGWLKENF